MLRLAAGIELTHVPYKGAAPVIAALLGGEVDMAFTTLPSAIPHVRAGRLRVLAVTTARPSPALAETPTIATLFPGFDIAIWYGLFAPAGTPAPIQDRLITDLRKAASAAPVRQALERDGAEPLWLAGAEFGAFIRREIEQYTALARRAKVRAE